MQKSDYTLTLTDNETGKQRVITLESIDLSNVLTHKAVELLVSSIKKTDKQSANIGELSES